MSLRGGFESRLGPVLALAAALCAAACGGGDSGGGGKTDTDASGFGGNGGSGPQGGEGGDVGGSGGTGGESPVGGTGGEVVGGTGGTGGTGGSVMPCTCERDLTCDADGQCVEQSPCADDLGCQAGRICVNGACADGCADDAACAGEGRANLCVEGRCIQCQTDGDCFGRSTCDPATHLCVEPEPCDDSRECISPNICNVRSRRCEAPFDCRVGGATCNEGLVCDDASGRCVVPPDGCMSNVSCPVGQVCAAGRPRVCRGCVADDECEGSQLCVRGLCEEGPCGGDADCLGSRVCVAGSCEAPACVEDDSEENDTLETAEVLPGGGAFVAQSCGGDDDFYRISLARNTAATISTFADSLGAELDLEVTDAAGDLIDSGRADGLSEVVVVGPYLVDRDLVVRVFQRGVAGSVGYQFDLGLQAVVGPDMCIDDAEDVRAGDDTIEAGRQLRPAGTPPIDLPLGGTLCEGDPDWFCVTLGDGEDLHVTGAVTSGDLVAEAELVQAGNGMSFGTVQWQRDQAGMELSRSARGNYCVRLQAVSGEGDYTIRFVTTSRAVEAFCADAEALALDPAGTAHVSGTLPDDDLLTLSCGSANTDGGEAAYTVEVDQPKLLVARVTGEAGGTLGDPMISVRSDCASPNGELACNDDRYEPDAPYLLEANPAEVRVPVTAAGTVTLIVDATAPGARPDYRLDVELLPLATPPANDRCAGVVPMELQDGLGRVRVSLDRARDDFGAACLPSSGPDAVYSLHVDARSRVSAQVYADFATGVYLTTGCGMGDVLGCGTGFDLDDVPAGDYFLVIEGVGDQARGRVQGQVIVEPIGPPPANDTCGSAELLDAVGGTVGGTTRGATADIQLADGNPCTGDNTSAGDVVYRLPVEGGASYFVEAVPEAGWDLSLFAVSNCAMPGATCLAGQDGALTERVEFTTGAGDTEVFIVVDGANGESGRFELTWGVLP